MVKCVICSASYKGEPIEFIRKNIMVKNENTRRLFPHLRECLDDPLTEKQRDLIMILEVIGIEKHVPSPVNASSTGRPPEDRRPLARAFVAKVVYNLPTTRVLIDFLHNMPSLRKICGFVRRNDIPSEPTFSRAFAKFALTELGDKVHKALVDTHLSDAHIGHIARDAIIIKGHEKPVPKKTLGPELPDNTRNIFTLGTTYKKDQFKIDLGYQATFFKRVSSSRSITGPRGTYSNFAHLILLGLTYSR
jgi:hypothetical protein